MLGRQYHGLISGNPLWHMEISGGVRSGRERMTAWLALVDINHRVSVRTTGDNDYRADWPGDEYESL